ncbi:MAG: efflux transporter outer membrane subunit [bacterium]
MNRTILLLPALLCCFSGCAMGPNYQRPPVSPPASFRDAPEAVPGHESASLADLSWFELYQDAQLRELIQTALENNYDIRIAVARVLEARARVTETGSALFPQIDAGAGAARQRSSENVYPYKDSPNRANLESNYFQGGFNLSWELDIWGRIRRQTEAARAEWLAQEWAQRAVTISILAEVARAYLDLRELDLELEIAKRTLAARKRSLQLTQLRKQEGVATRLEVRQAETLVYSASARIPALEGQIRQTENTLSLLLARPPGDIPRGPALTGQPVPPEIPAGLPSDLLERRPDIREMEEMLIAANAQIGVAKALYFPRLSLTGFVGLESQDLEDFISSHSDTWSIAANALQPVFNAGRIRAMNLAAQARYTQMLAQYEKVIQTAFQEVSGALIGFQKTRELREQQELLVQSLQDRLRLANRRFLGGTDSYLQVLDAEKDLFDAELALAQVQRDELLYIVYLYKALGGGWEKDAPLEAAGGKTDDRVE